MKDYLGGLSAVTMVSNALGTPLIHNREGISHVDGLKETLVACSMGGLDELSVLQDGLMIVVSF